MAQVVLGELVESLVESSQRMSNKNRNKVLVLQAAEILMQMALRIAQLEEAEKARESRIVLVN